MGDPYPSHDCTIVQPYPYYDMVCIPSHMKPGKQKTQYWTSSEKTCPTRLGWKWRVIKPWVTQEILGEANGVGIKMPRIKLRLKRQPKHHMPCSLFIRFEDDCWPNLFGKNWFPSSDDVRNVSQMAAISSAQQIRNFQNNSTKNMSNCSWCSQLLIWHVRWCYWQ